MGLMVSVHRPLVPRQTHHGTRVWWRKADHFIAAKKQRAEERALEKTPFKGTPSAT